MNTYFSVYRFVFICPLEPSLLSPRWLMISASGGSHSMGPFWQPTVKNTMRILQPQRFANPPSMGLPFFQSCSLSPEIATIKTLPCVANHGWMPEPPSLKQIQAACMNIPDFSHDGLLAATLASISTRFHDFPEVTFNLTSWLLRPSTDKHLWITSRLNHELSLSRKEHPYSGSPIVVPNEAPKNVLHIGWVISAVADLLSFGIRERWLQTEEIYINSRWPLRHTSLHHCISNLKPIWIGIQRAYSIWIGSIQSDETAQNWDKRISHVRNCFSAPQHYDRCDERNPIISPNWLVISYPPKKTLSNTIEPP